MGKIVFSPEELEGCKPGHYPACFRVPRDFDHFFVWSKTRQGDLYWRGKWESCMSEVEYLNGNLAGPITQPDKEYMALLCFAKKHNLRKIEFTAGCRLDV
jgi:hypothetical protein